jgi:CheY-like chemotaxis protein
VRVTKSILLVEDEPLLAMVLEELLLELGHTVTIALNGAEGLAALEKASPFDALVTDIRLPKVDGWALARRARELRPDIPVIYVTGDSAADRQAKGVSGSVLLSKPFSPEAFVRTVTLQLGG